MKTYRSPRQVLAKVEQLLAGDKRSPHPPTMLDRVAESLHEARHYFWIGIYLLAGDRLVLQAFRGPTPPHTSFAPGEGDVGIAAQTGMAKVVADVETDPNYRMWFSETRSKMVVPIRIAGKVLGVVDVNSDSLNAFGSEDYVLIKDVAARLARFLTGKGKYLVRKAKEAASQEGASPVRQKTGGLRPGPRKSAAAPKPSRRVAAGELSRK